MLCEIVCEQFCQKKIELNDGLSVILGTKTGNNSIGKSTLMLIIDYVFGGNKYSESKDILDQVGDHEICFKFRFSQQDYYFARSFVNRDQVWRCNSDYSHNTVIKKNEFCNWLAQQYEIDLYKLSFRDAAGRFIRAYGKDNCDEKHPLNAVPSEPGEKAVIALLKIFDRYKSIYTLEERAKQSRESLQSYKKAQKYQFVEKVSKEQYNKNTKEINRLKTEVERLVADLSSGLLDTDAVLSERAIELKNQLSHARRMRNRIASRLSIIDTNSDYSFSMSAKTVSELKRFFPGVDIEHIERIEDFHRKISQVFRSELYQEKKKLQMQLDEIDSCIDYLKNELMGIIQNPNIPKCILQKHADAVKAIERMRRENESYEAQLELSAAKRADEESLLTAKKNELGIVETKINVEMARINGLLYIDKYNSPVLHFTDKSYVFFTPDDTGTGIAFKGLAVYDLAIMHLTKIPVLVHDSVVLKQISDDALENIITQYCQCNKQVIIALDKHSSYSEKTASMLEEHCVLQLKSGGGELFGRFWGKSDNEGR